MPQRKDTFILKLSGRQTPTITKRSNVPLLWDKVTSCFFWSVDYKVVAPEVVDPVHAFIRRKIMRMSQGSAFLKLKEGENIKLYICVYI